MKKLNMKAVVAGIIGVVGIGTAIYNIKSGNNYTSLPIGEREDEEIEEIETESEIETVEE